jgi:hypothetical protein
MVYINTLMIQNVLAQPHWHGRLTPRDYAALTPLIWEHVNPYGRFDLEHERSAGAAVIEMAAGNTPVGSTPNPSTAAARSGTLEKEVTPVRGLFTAFEHNPGTHEVQRGFLIAHSIGMLI